MPAKDYIRCRVALPGATSEDVLDVGGFTEDLGESGAPFEITEDGVLVRTLEVYGENSWGGGSPVELDGEVVFDVPDDTRYDYTLRFEGGRLVWAERFSYADLAVDAQVIYDRGRPYRLMP